MYKCPICGTECGREHRDRKIIQHLTVTMDTQGHVNVHHNCSKSDKSLTEIMIDTVIEMLALRNFPGAVERCKTYQDLYTSYKLDRAVGDTQWLEKLKKARTADDRFLRELIGI